MTVLPIDQITLVERHRTDLGDIQGLADSMTQVGLLQPIVVTPENRLVAGHRRVVAARSLGWTEIDVVTVTNLTDAAGLLQAESDENTCRKAFTPTEAERIASAREALLKPLAEERQKAGLPSAKFAGGSNGRTREAASAGSGFSHETIRKVREVREISESETAPEPVREAAKRALTVMDETGKVDGAHKAVKQAEAAAAPDPLGDYLAADTHLQDLSYIANFSKAVYRAREFLQFDAERIGTLIDNDLMVSLDYLLESVTEYRARVIRARSGLRVIKGGS